MPDGCVERSHGKLTAEALALYLVPACSERWRCDEQSRRDGDENEPELLQTSLPLVVLSAAGRNPKSYGRRTSIFEHFIVVRASGNAPIRSPTSLIASARRPAPERRNDVQVPAAPRGRLRRRRGDLRADDQAGRGDHRRQSGVLPNARMSTRRLGQAKRSRSRRGGAWPRQLQQLEPTC
jgi:hypothetical protein